MAHPGTITPPPPRSVDLAGPRPAERSIREQLDRILTHSLFANSKRYPGLLRYVVEQNLGNPSHELKERVIGIDVFERDPDYDTNRDPVVRTSAVEVRKRLAEYYRDPAHVKELRIDLPIGSYIPQFHEPLEMSTTIAEPLVPVIAEPVPRKEPHFPGAKPQEKRRYALAVIAIFAVLTGIGVWRWLAPAPIDDFWAPLWESSTPVLVGISGGPEAQPPVAAGATQPSFTDLFYRRQEYVPFGDASAMANVLNGLRRRNTPIRMAYLSSLQLADLKTGPSILIGPVTRWVEMVRGNLRYSVTRDAAVTVTWIADREHPEKQDWSVKLGMAATSTAEAYALVNRFWNPLTGKFMVTISGLSPFATSAAGEFVSDPAQMNDLLRSAPSGWKHRNVQIVVAVTRVGTSIGRPHAVASYYW